MEWSNWSPAQEWSKCSPGQVARQESLGPAAELRSRGLKEQRWEGERVGAWAPGLPTQQVKEILAGMAPDRHEFVMKALDLLDLFIAVGTIAVRAGDLRGGSPPVA